MLRRLKNIFYFFNSIRISSSSQLLCQGELSKSRVLISGMHNTMTVEQNAKLSNVNIQIDGDDNRCVIGRGCLIENESPNDKLIL